MTAFWQGILLKISFKPEKVRRAQAALLYVALTGQTFTADCIPDEICNDMTTAGCAVRTLKQIGLIEYVAQDAANATRVKVKVTAKLIIHPVQTMKIICKAFPSAQ